MKKKQMSPFHRLSELFQRITVDVEWHKKVEEREERIRERKEREKALAAAGVAAAAEGAAHQLRQPNQPQQQEEAEEPPIKSDAEVRLNVDGCLCGWFVCRPLEGFPPNE